MTNKSKTMDKIMNDKIDAAAQQWESATQHEGLGPAIFKAGVEYAMTYAKLTEASRSQKLVEALEEIAEGNCDYESTIILGKLHKPDCRACKAKEVLQQYNATPDRPCPHCGKELSRDRNLCCRECGKEVKSEV